MEFGKQKQAVLKRQDKSLIGAIDEPIKGLVDAINSLDGFYTTSSCSGRIGLLHKISEHKGMEWVYKSHELLKARQLAELMAFLKEGEEVWFRQEQLILHVCCADIDSAKRLMTIAQKAGFKRPGIIALGKRIIVEIKNDNIINALVAKSGFAADEGQLRLLVEEANSKLKENFAKITLFEKGIKKV